MGKRAYPTDAQDATGATDAAAAPGVTVDRDAEIPIGVQLAWALRTRIRDGAYQPGQRLPGLRELADATGVNVNTVRTVYQRLEREGLVDTQQGSGTFVALAQRQPSALGAIVAEAVRGALETGVDPREVAAALYVAPDGAAAVRDEQARRRRALREQIGSLERTLAELEAKHPSLVRAPKHRRAGPGPALLDENELEHIRDTLVRRLGSLQTAIDALAGAGKRAQEPARGRARTQARESAGAPRRGESAQRPDSGAKRVDGEAPTRRRARSEEQQRTPRSRPTASPAPAGA